MKDSKNLQEQDNSIFGLRVAQAPSAEVLPVQEKENEETPAPWQGMATPQQEINPLESTAQQPQSQPEPAKQTTPPTKYWGIRFSETGQVFFFPAADFTVRVGTKVLMSLENGPLLGEVSIILDRPETPISPGELGEGSITRLASANDVAIHAENHILAAEASAFCKTCIRQRNLDMKLAHVEVMHDVSKIIFFFTAPARIDFRELVKDLVSTYRTRIELRQIGVRHEAQMIGGIGNCGMVCCCHSYLRKFAPVAIKMAKEQNLFLNPAKLSGMCGRLLCCLSFEQNTYEAFNKRCPKIGKKYRTDMGNFKVLRTNMMSDSISVISDKNEEVEINLSNWEQSHPTRMENQSEDSDDFVTPEELAFKKAHADLEDSEQKPRHQPQKQKKRKLPL